VRGTTIKLTIFTIFTIVVTFGLATLIGKIGVFSDTYEIDAIFTDATGVLNGDPVKIAGVEVGKVSSFEVTGGEARVTMEISSDVELPENVMAEIKFRNLLGQRIINLERPETPSSEPLPREGGTIPVENTKPALDLSVVFNNLRPLIQSTNPEHINTVSRAVLAIFKGREGDLEGVLGNLGELTTELAGRDQRLAKLIDNLDEVTQILDDESDNVRVGLQQFTEFMEALAEVTPAVERTVDQLDSASSRFGGIIRKNRSNLDQELRDLATLLGLVEENLGPLDRIAKQLKEVLLATARTQSYGKWWTLYVVNLCVEGVPDVPDPLTCPN
jgi:phospholipid/cholesterol/gamma-HCH transport system substrate-binding protein